MKTYLNKTIKTIVSALFIMPILASCTGDGKVLSIGEPEFVKEFPVTVGNLQKIETFDCDEIGVFEVKVIDTLLFINKSNTWTIYSLDGSKKYGECLRTGNGPGEFTVFVPFLNYCHFFDENDSLFVHVPDTQKGNVWCFNISDILAGGGHSPYPVIETELIQNAIPSAIVYEKEKVLVYQPEYNYTRIKRMLYDGDTLRQMPVTQDIDRITLEKRDDINVIARITSYNATSDKFVEAMIYLNQINIISGDGTEGKTICVGKKLDDISKIENEDFAARIKDYTSVLAWDDGFGVTYSGATELDYQLFQSNDFQIQFFDWNGTPKCLVEIPYHTSSFDIDFTNNIMYVVDRQNDKLIAYDATEIVKCLKS